MRYCSNGLLSLANLGDTNKPDPRYPLQDASGNWQQLPYEVAHGVAKTTVQHGSDVIAAKKEYVKQKAADHEETKGKTKAAREEMEKLNSVDRFIIYNRRTGQLACADCPKAHLCRRTRASEGKKPEINQQTLAHDAKVGNERYQCWDFTADRWSPWFFLPQNQMFQFQQRATKWEASVPSFGIWTFAGWQRLWGRRWRGHHGFSHLCRLTYPLTTLHGWKISFWETTFFFCIVTSQGSTHTHTISWH